MSIFKWQDESVKGFESYRLKYAMWDAEVNFDEGTQAGWFNSASQRGWYYTVYYRNSVNYWGAEDARFANKEDAIQSVESIIKLHCKQIVEAAGL